MRFRSAPPLRRLWRNFCNQTASKSEPSSSRITGKCSYLYVGRSELPYTVEPDLNFRNRFSDTETLHRLLDARGYDVDSAFGDLRLLSEKYERWLQMATAFAETYPKERTKGFAKTTDSEEFRAFKRAISDLDQLEQEVIPACLRLPADLHPWTPIGERAERLATFVNGRQVGDGLPDSPLDQGTSHMELLHSTTGKFPLVEFNEDPPQCFILGSAALLLRALEVFFAKSLFEAGYRRFSPPYFARSSVIEAYFGHSESADQAPLGIPIESIYGEKGYDTTWALNVVGHGPLPYLALFTRKVLSSRNAFPLKFFSHGMAYSGNYGDQASAFGAWTLFNFPIQRPRVTMGLVFETENDLEISDLAKATVQDLLSKLQLSFTIGQQPSRRLIMSEMSRVDVVAFSENDPTRNVRLAAISNHGDFLSRRIRLMSREETGPKTSGQGASKSEYLKCCFAEIDLYNILGRLYEEQYPKANSGMRPEDFDWWPSVLHG